MVERILNVLFLCSDNSSRSILAESILRKDGGARFNAMSGGVHPAADVNPVALMALSRAGYPVVGLTSKNLCDVTTASTPDIDFVFTLSDELEAQDLSQLPGKPVRAHWGISDPAAIDGTDIEKERAFVTAVQQLRRRVSAFGALPFKGLNKMTLQVKLGEIGLLE